MSNNMNYEFGHLRYPIMHVPKTIYMIPFQAQEKDYIGVCIYSIVITSNGYPFFNSDDTMRGATYEKRSLVMPAII